MTAVSFFNCSNLDACSSFYKGENNTMPVKSEFYKQMRRYFLYFNLFGICTVWQNSKHKLFFQLHLIFCSIVVLFVFIYAIFFNQFFERNSLLGNINNFLFIFIFASHSTIILETLFSPKIQMQIIEKFSFVDEFFAIKFGIETRYQFEKQKLLALSVVLMVPVILTNIMILL